MESIPTASTAFPKECTEPRLPFLTPCGFTHICSPGGEYWPLLMEGQGRNSPETFSVFLQHLGVVNNFVKNNLKQVLASLTIF